MARDDKPPLQQNLKLLAEKQLNASKNFTGCLEDSRVREERLYEALDVLDDEIAVFDLRRHACMCEQGPSTNIATPQVRRLPPA